MPKLIRHSEIPLELLEAIQVVPVHSGINSGLVWTKTLTKKALIGEEAAVIQNDIVSQRKEWVIRALGKSFIAARVIYTKAYNRDPKNLTIDHIDGDTLNNNINNLRAATKQQQQLNRTIPCNNTSGAKGVFKTKNRTKWEARLRVNSECIYLGTFNCKIEAALAYNKAVLKHHPDEFVQLNNINLLECFCDHCTKKNPLV